MISNSPCLSARAYEEVTLAAETLRELGARIDLFEDNSGAIEIATGDKVRPRTKHINVRYHHFRQLVENKTLVIEAIRSEDNPADILTHPVTLERLAKHVTSLLKWNLLPAVSEGVLQCLKQAVNSDC